MLKSKYTRQYERYKAKYLSLKNINDILSDFDRMLSKGAILITQNDDILFEKYYNNLKDSQFRIFSLTKPIAGLAIMTLIDKNLLSIETTLDDLKIKIPNSDKITVWHLLNHESGIHDIVSSLYFKKQPIELFNKIYNKNSNETKMVDFEEYLELLNKSEPVFGPGDQHKYNNTGYDILGYIIYLVSGMKTTEYIRDNIFAKLGMTNSTFHGHKLSHEALPYDENGNIGVKEQYDFFGTNANIICTLRDYNKFMNNYQSLLTDKTLEIYKKLYYFGIWKNSEGTIIKNVFTHKGMGDFSHSYGKSSANPENAQYISLSRSFCIKFLDSNINIIVHANYLDEKHPELYMLNWLDGSIFRNLLDYVIGLETNVGHNVEHNVEHSGGFLLSTKTKNTIIHISGPSGAGKTTLGNKLKEKYKDKIVVKDVDDLLYEFIDRNYSKKKWNWNKFDAHKYQNHIDNYVTKQQKPLILVGLNNNMPWHNSNLYYNMHSQYNYYIDIDDINVVKQKCSRFFNSVFQDKNAMNDLVNNNKQFLKISKDGMNFSCDIKYIMKENKKWSKDYKKQGYIFMSREKIFDKVCSILDSIK